MEESTESGYTAQDFYLLDDESYIILDPESLTQLIPESLKDIDDDDRSIS